MSYTGGEGKEALPFPRPAKGGAGGGARIQGIHTYQILN